VQTGKYYEKSGLALVPNLTTDLYSMYSSCEEVRQTPGWLSCFSLASLSLEDGRSFDFGKRLDQHLLTHKDTYVPFCTAVGSDGGFFSLTTPGFWPYTVQ
jgi:hypothetical protein